MNIVPRLGLLTPVGVLIAVCAAPSVFAETTVEVRENDTLSSIVAAAYPGQPNRNALMRLILEHNPRAFNNNDIDFLISGKTLKLPDIDELKADIVSTASVQQIPQAQSVAVSPVTAEAERRLNQIVKERDLLKQQLEKLEADNQNLKNNISRLETARTQQNAQLAKLEEQIALLKSRVEEQVAARDAIPPAVAKQLSESKEKLRQLQSRYDESVSNNKELQQQLTEKAALESETSQLKQQIAELQGGDSVSPEIAKQLSESNEKLKQLQGRYDASVKNNKELQQQLTEKTALESETSQLKQQIAELQGGGNTQKNTNTELQSQLNDLKQKSESLRVDNEKVLSELSVVNAKLETSQSETATLRTELGVANKKLESSQSETAALRTELGVANQQLEAIGSETATLRTELDTTAGSNTALKNEIDQIKAAAEKDVALSPANPSEQPGSTWWPWLLALLLLPVAWFLGQRSRPAPVTDTPEAVKAAAGVKTVEMLPAAIDPVVPAPLTSDQLEHMAFPAAEVITTPDDPDAAIKLDMARAYLDLRNAEAANDVLQEVIQEGGSLQRQEAKEILSFIA